MERPELSGCWLAKGDPEYGDNMQTKVMLAEMEQCPSSVQTALVQGEGDGGSSGCLCYLGQGKAGSQTQAMCVAGSQPRHLRLRRAGVQSCRGLRILRAGLCSYSCTCASRSFIMVF